MALPAEPPELGETWVYESLVGSIPGVHLSPVVAASVQFLLFEVGVVALAWVYDLWDAVLPGTVAIVVAAFGSVVMLDLSTRIRGLDVPETYRRLLFGSSIEVVLGLVAYVALLTYLFVYDPPDADPLLEALLGPSPPWPAVYLALLVAWDVCYRIGTGWWTAVAAFWRSRRYAFDTATGRELRSIDYRNVGFGVLQLALLPFVLDYPLLAAALVGHVVAVILVAGYAARRG
ncbi:hypothetical protein ACFQH6_01105 [Halobacteriaceae archaeon GCM10025711]